MTKQNEAYEIALKTIKRFNIKELQDDDMPPQPTPLAVVWSKTDRDDCVAELHEPDIKALILRVIVDEEPDGDYTTILKEAQALLITLLRGKMQELWLLKYEEGATE